MKKTKQFRKICRKLRQQGFTLTEIVKKTGKPKTSIYYHIKDIPLSKERRKEIKNKSTKRLNAYIKNNRKGISTKNDNLKKPKKWTGDLVFVISHLIFDGYFKKGGFEYYNNSKKLINKMKLKTSRLFNIKTKLHKSDHKVNYINYFNIELNAYIKKKSKELLKYIKTASIKHKRVFLKSFFDDEGCVSFYKKSRKVRGYQHNIKILKIVKKLLLDFQIESSIENKNTEIVIRRKENLKKFQKEINFSKGIYINPNRKNSVWNKKIEKRKILKKAINSYQNLNRKY